MTTRQTLKRIVRLERLMLPQDDGDRTISMTLDQLCRECWKDLQELLIAEPTSSVIFQHTWQHLRCEVRP